MPVPKYTKSMTKDGRKGGGRGRTGERKREGEGEEVREKGGWQTPDKG